LHRQRVGVDRGLKRTTADWFRKLTELQRQRQTAIIGFVKRGIEVFLDIVSKERWLAAPESARVKVLEAY